MLSYTYAEKQIKRGNHCEKSKAVLLAAAIPTVLLIAVILLVIFGVKYLNGFNEAQLDIKQDNLHPPTQPPSPAKPSFWGIPSQNITLWRRPTAPLPKRPEASSTTAASARKQAAT